MEQLWVSEVQVCYGTVKQEDTRVSTVTLPPLTIVSQGESGASLESVLACRDDVGCLKGNEW
jgi:hypothetical protein